MVQNRVIRLVKVRFAQDLDSAVLPLAKQLSSGNNALHAVCVMETIKNAAHAALHKQSAFVPHSAPSRLFISKYYNAEAMKLINTFTYSAIFYENQKKTKKKAADVISAAFSN